MALKGKFYWKLINNQQSIHYIAGPKREGMPFSRKFFRSMSNKITKKYQFHFFISFIKQKGYMTQKHFSSERE